MKGHRIRRFTGPALAALALMAAAACTGTGNEKSGTSDTNSPMTVPSQPSPLSTSPGPSQTPTLPGTPSVPG